MRTAGLSRGSLAYSMGGVGGEAGEYIDVVKKFLFHSRPEEESREKARLELGDLLWGIAQAADAWGFTLSEIAAGNVDKLRARYPAGFTVAAAAAKADERRPVERSIVGYDANGSPVEPTGARRG